MNPPENIPSKDEYVPFSSSAVWNDLRQFYQTQGISAWDNKVPFMASSHALLAESLSQVICNFWLESLSQSEPASNKPFLVIELGAGHGIFSFYLLRRLCDWYERTSQTFTFVYIMSDLAESNIEFWRTHPSLALYIEKKYLDFAIWNAETNEPLITEFQTIQLTANTKYPQPITVVANYLFDSLSCEYLQANNGALYRGWMPLAPEKQMAAQEAEFLLPSLQFFPLENNELNDPYCLLKKINQSIKNTESKTPFLFPSGAISVLDHFRMIAGTELLFLVTDKGNARSQLLFPPSTPMLAIHHSLSAEVPFDILSDWAQAAGGYSCITKTTQAVQQAGFLFSNKKMQITKNLLHQQFVNCPAGNVFTLMQTVVDQKEKNTLRTLIACLNACQWDPFVFDRLYPILSQLLQVDSKTSLFLLADLIDGVTRVADQHYFIPGKANTFFHIGQLMHILGQFKMAIYYYQCSLENDGNQPETRLAIGECLIGMGNLKDALAWIESVLKEQPENFLARGYRDFCNEKLHNVNSTEQYN